MKINMASPVNIYNNKPYNKSQPAFGKFIVTGNIPPQVVSDLLSKKGFIDLVKDADANGFNIDLSHYESSTTYSVIAEERGQAFSEGKTLAVQDIFEPMNLEKIRANWEEYKKKLALRNSVNADTKAQKAVAELVKAFNAAMGFNN